MKNKKLTINDINIVEMPTNPNRYVIVQKNTYKLINDANGYGFISKQKAKNAINFILNGGLLQKQKIKNWWKQHNEFLNKIQDIVWHGFKDGLSQKEINKEILYT